MKDYKELKDFRDVPAEEFRRPMLIKTYRHYSGYRGSGDYPDCPRCGAAIGRDYQKFCDNCGQRLKWNFSKMKCRIWWDEE